MRHFVGNGEKNIYIYSKNMTNINYKRLINEAELLGEPKNIVREENQNRYNVKTLIRSLLYHRNISKKNLIKAIGRYNRLYNTQQLKDVLLIIHFG